MKKAPCLYRMQNDCIKVDDYIFSNARLNIAGILSKLNNVNANYLLVFIFKYLITIFVNTKHNVIFSCWPATYWMVLFENLQAECVSHCLINCNHYYRKPCIIIYWRSIFLLTLSMQFSAALAVDSVLWFAGYYRHTKQTNKLTAVKIYKFIMV